MLVEPHRRCVPGSLSVPTAIKPVVVHAKRATWSESKLAELIAALPDPVNMMLALANRTGLSREVCRAPPERPRHDPEGLSHREPQLRKPAEGRPARRRQGEEGPGAGRRRGSAASARRVGAFRAGAGRYLFFVPTKTSKQPRANDWRGYQREHPRSVVGGMQNGEASWTTRASQP